MRLADPGRHERKKRKPEKQIKIRSQDAAINVLGSVQHVMMVDPVDA